jgi:hypothetical protein
VEKKVRLSVAMPTFCFAPHLGLMSRADAERARKSCGGCPNLILWLALGLASGALQALSTAPEYRTVGAPGHQLLSTHPAKEPRSHVK